jgi:hypothetical protein
MFHIGSRKGEMNMNRIQGRASGVVAALGFAFLALVPGVSFAQAAVDVCSQIPLLSATGLVAGATNGDFGFIGQGETVTMSATRNTATGGTFRIVGDPAGTVTLAGPSPIPGTLTYNGTGAVPPGGVGVGYFIDTAVGGTVNIAASCSLQPVPATSPQTLLVLALLLLAAGGYAARKIGSRQR